MRLIRAALAPVLVLVAGACVATRSDLRVLQNDLAIMRAESVQADSLRRAQLDSVLVALGRANDSLEMLSSRFGRFQADARSELFSLGQQLIQVQELTGQSQRRLQELRASLEARAVPPADATPAEQPGAATPAAPGPNQLFQLALDQLRRGSAGAARTGFQELLTRYPTADVAPDAQFYIAESHAQEGNASAADSAYALVISRYPESARAATALYKRGVMLQAGGDAAAARAVFEDVIRRYPRSDEAVLARERLRAPR